MTPDSPALWERARRWASQGRYDDAEAAYREALRLAPDDVRARLGLGLCLRRQRRPADAEAVLREAVLLQPGSASIHAELGGALFEQRQYTGAAAGFREGTPPPPHLARAPPGLGRPVIRPGGPGRAQAAFCQAA